MIDDIRLGWAALRESPRPEGSALAVRALDVMTGGPDPVLLAMDARARCHVLIPARGVGPDEEDRVDAVRVGSRTLEFDGAVRDFADIVLETPALAEVFDHFAVAVLDAVRTDPESHPGVVALAVLDAWRRFLVLAGRPLGPERLAPVLAELIVLADIAAFGVTAVETWRGPGARHDFARGAWAIEVKSTRAHTSREITVHGVDQLDSPAGGRLFIEFIRLEDAVGTGLSVPDVVDRILERGVPAGSLYAAVERAGLAPSDYPDARAILFTVRERALLPVLDPFPRIVPEVFRDGEPPPGIRDLVYRANLDTVIHRRLPPERAEEVYRLVAGGGA